MNLGILKLFKISLIFALVQVLSASVQSFDFDLIKKGKTSEINNTLLIIGGIQGDEPGGFTAAALLSTHYEITKGSVWVVPNLNFYSIIKKSRGPFGDMNRKFAKLDRKDPDYNSIQRIKNYIKAPEVKIVLNLHDGSGFYRKKYIDNMHSPYRWGQSSIIDQEKLNVDKYGNLLEISNLVCNHVNKFLIKKRDRYSVKNTHTKRGNAEMEKTLTYFAINNGKAAFGNEASKTLPLNERTYYHLLALEKYMNLMGIEYKRNFELTPKAIKHLITNDIYISFNDGNIRLPLAKIRKLLRYFPIKKDGTLEFIPSNPLMTIIKNKNVYTIHYGNNKLASLSPDYLDMYEFKQNIQIKVDGVLKDFKLGSIVDVSKNFMISPIKNLRINVIGYVNKKHKNESGLSITKKEIIKRYSIDKNGKIFRVEFYKKKKFVGMLLINFSTKLRIKKNNFVNTQVKKIVKENFIYRDEV